MIRFDDMYSEAFYNQLMQLPDADRVVRRAVDQLAYEEKDRIAFRKWLTPSVKAEFINGQIIMHSPVRNAHLVASSNLVRLLGTYVDVKEIGRVFFEKALVEVGRNDFEPDIAYWRTEQTLAWTKSTNVFPPPTLVIEILSKSTAGRDRGVKFQSYLAHEVPEYWIVDPMGEVIEQYVLSTDDAGVNRYRLSSKVSEDDVLVSTSIEGFSFPAAAAFSDSLSLRWVRDLLAE